MFQNFIQFLDDHAWAPWAGMIVFGGAVLAIDYSPTFPYNLFPFLG